MIKPTRYTKEMFDEYFSKGLWTMDTTADLWERNAKLFPSKEAFVDSKRRLTWSQLKLMSDRLALSLLELDLHKDELIFILLPNCVESFIMRVSCEKAGILCGTALMTIREMEIENTLNSFDAVGIAIPMEFRGFNYFIAINEMRPKLPKLKHIFVMGEEIPPGTSSIEKMMQQPLENNYSDNWLQETKIKATEVSIIGFTSGTTGMPKGAEHVQCARMAMARGYGEGPKIDENDIVLNIISPVGGLTSAFCYTGSATLVAAKVVLSEIWSPEKTFELIEREKVTILLAVPAQLAQIVRHTKISAYNLSSLRCICTSTAPLTYTLASDLEETFKVPILNFYGQFDGGLISNTNMDGPPEVRHRTVGKPLKNNMIRLVDEEGRDVKLGEVGEVIYNGPSASSGYYKDIETTLRVWGKLGRDGYCRSGDLAKFDEEGNLVLMGRKKDVIIRGGQNIYPAEIEGLLLTHPKIKSVAIVPMPDPIMGEKVCSYVSLKPGEQFTFEEMLSFLKSMRVANYKLPERLEILDELPLRGHQKINKTFLREDIIQKFKEEGKL
jgi:non-ribosomal peptide synthetase component E (peptide arylation enzyme)